MAHIQKVRGRPRKDGSVKVSWRAVWKGVDGTRHTQTFELKRDADAHLKLAGCRAEGGSPSMSVGQLAAEHYKFFDGLVKSGRRAAVTRDGYGTDMRHVLSVPSFASIKLCDLNTPRTQKFLDDFITDGGAIGAAKDLRRSIGVWCKFGQRRGWINSNPALATKVETNEIAVVMRRQVDVPEKEELAQLLAACQSPRENAVVRLLMFAGLRISELTGMADLMIDGNRLRVVEKLDRHYVELGQVKTAKALRVVPIGNSTALAVRTWKLSRGAAKSFMHKGARVGGRLFNHHDGSDLWAYNDFWREFWMPLMQRAGFVQMLPDSKGKLRPVIAFGPHTLRHVAASLWIEQGLTPKKVQHLLGHSTILLTMNLYGHLWRDDALDDKLAAASERLIG